MPVADHPVHPHGVRPAGHKAGCHNRTGLTRGYWARDGLDMQTDVESGVTYAIQKMTWTPHTLSTDCRQTTELPECLGCLAPKDWEYINRMRKL